MKLEYIIKIKIILNFFQLIKKTFKMIEYDISI